LDDKIRPLIFSTFFTIFILSITGHKYSKNVVTPDSKKGFGNVKLFNFFEAIYILICSILQVAQFNF
jgi:hypothetical protein